MRMEIAANEARGISETNGRIPCCRTAGVCLSCTGRQQHDEVEMARERGVSGKALSVFLTAARSRLPLRVFPPLRARATLSRRRWRSCYRGTSTTASCG